MLVMKNSIAVRPAQLLSLVLGVLGVFEATLWVARTRVRTVLLSHDTGKTADPVGYLR